jgi:hypothetical protein
MAVQYAFGKIITQGLDLNVDAADPTSYPGSGNTWTSVVNRSITGSVISCSFSSDFKGGIVFDNPSASVQFPGTVANYGTGSFTIEMAFRPSSIEGIHYLVSKNSGSFPNWGVYLSGSGGSGKLFAEYNIDASVSCSVSSSTVFETGSNYFVDVQLQPGISGSLIYNNGGLEAGVTGNGGGSLTTTGSLFLGNISPSSSQAYSGSLFFNRIYQTETLTTAYFNFNPSKTRIQVGAKPPILVRMLVVGGGGAGANGFGGGGGGAGGFIETTLPIASSTTYTAFVGDGGANAGVSTQGVPSSNGTSSFFSAAPSILTAFGGGRGGNENGGAGAGSIAQNGASGGGAGSRFNQNTVGDGIPGQGFAGGIGAFTQGGGGGGASNTGSSASSGGAGGPGKPSDISGVLTYYAGGGTGGASTTRPGGIGGGGSGGSTVSTSGTPNTGGGGGGIQSAGPAGAGGSGIVIIRYPGVPIATGGTITSVGGDTIHTFTATGSHTFTVL